jgi:hypothetical protein
MRFVLAVVTLFYYGVGEQITEPAGILTSVNGTINIMRVQMNDTIHAGVLDYLFKGDTLVVDDTSSATIFFKNGALMIIEANTRFGINNDILDTLGLSIKKPLNSKKMAGLFDDICILKNEYEKMAAKNPRKHDDSIRCVIQYPGNTALINARPDME